MLLIETITKDIASLILKDPLTAIAGYYDEEKGVRPEVVKLKQIVAGTRKADNGLGSLLNLSFRNEASEVSLYVDYDMVDYHADPVINEDGDEFAKVKVFTRLNWPTHGNRSSVQAQEILSLYAEVTRLAAEIDRFVQNKEIWILTNTKADRERQAVIAAKREQERKVKALVASESARMRVKQAKPLPIPESLPEGVYEEMVGKKLFTLTVTKNGAFLTRDA